MKKTGWFPGKWSPCVATLHQYDMKLVWTGSTRTSYHAADVSRWLLLIPGSYYDLFSSNIKNLSARYVERYIYLDVYLKTFLTWWTYLTLIFNEQNNRIVSQSPCGTTCQMCDTTFVWSPLWTQFRLDVSCYGSFIWAFCSLARVYFI